MNDENSFYLKTEESKIRSKQNESRRKHTHTLTLTRREEDETLSVRFIQTRQVECKNFIFKTLRIKKKNLEKYSEISFSFLVEQIDSVRWK